MDQFGQTFLQAFCDLKVKNVSLCKYGSQSYSYLQNFLTNQDFIENINFIFQNQ